jgi:hypothetical protein
MLQARGLTKRYGGLLALDLVGDQGITSKYHTDTICAFRIR